MNNQIELVAEPIKQASQTAISVAKAIARERVQKVWNDAAKHMMQNTKTMKDRDVYRIFSKNIPHYHGENYTAATASFAAVVQKSFFSKLTIKNSVENLISYLAAGKSGSQVFFALNANSINTFVIKNFDSSAAFMREIQALVLLKSTIEFERRYYS